MKQVLFSTKARKDLVSIRVYTELNWSRQQSIKYINLMLDECFSVPDKEAFISFRAYKDYFFFHCGHHFVFFKSTDQKIMISRILHDKQNFAKHLE